MNSENNTQPNDPEEEPKIESFDGNTGEPIQYESNREIRDEFDKLFLPPQNPDNWPQYQFEAWAESFGKDSSWLNENFVIQENGEIQTKGDLDLEDSQITFFPPKLVLTGGLNLSGCQNLLPGQIHDLLERNPNIKGNLILEENTETNLLPSNLETVQGLSLACTSLTTLPPNLRLTGSLSLFDCPNLPHEEIYKLLKNSSPISGYLSLCKVALQFFPPDLKIQDDIYLQSCKELTQESIIALLENNSPLNQTVDLTNMPTLQEFSCSADFKGQLRFFGCSNLSKVSKIKSEHLIYLTDCSALQKIDDITLQDSLLQTIGCPLLQVISNVKIDSNSMVELDPMHNLHYLDPSIPNDLIQGIEPEEIAQLKQNDPQNPPSLEIRGEYFFHDEDPDDEDPED